MKQLNLYQSEFRPPKVLLPARALVFSGMVFMVGLLVLYVWGNWQLSSLKQQVAQVVQRADALTHQVKANAPGAHQADPTSVAEAQTLEARVRALQLAQDAIASGALGSETGYSAQFSALARALGNSARPGAWLTHVKISESGHAMDLQGRALTGADSARLIANLRREPLFVGLSFAGLDVHAPKMEGATEEAASAQPVATAGRSPEVRTPPRFLEFSLNARLSESATAKPVVGVAQKQGSTP
jgi:hypothetical protein